MPAEVQSQTLDQVSQIVELRVMGLIDDLMDDKQRETFAKFSKEGPERVMKWLSEELVDVNKLYLATLEDYITDLTSRK